MKKVPANDVRVMTALLTARPEKLEEMIQTLDPLLDEARALSGCVESLVGQDLKGQGQFLLYLVWKDLAALESYMASEGFRVLLGASRTLAFPVTFRFCTGDGDPVVHISDAPHEGPSPSTSGQPPV